MKKKQDKTDLRIDPEKRICPIFDATSVAKYPVAQPEDMGFRVLDDCAFEHKM